MVRGAVRDVGELRAVADVLGHTPDMLMKVYAHALPESTRAIADRTGQRTPAQRTSRERQSRRRPAGRLGTLDDVAKRARDLGDDVIVVIEDEFSALSDEEMAEALTAWLRSVETPGDPEIEFLDAASAVREAPMPD